MSELLETPHGEAQQLIEENLKSKNPLLDLGNLQPYGHFFSERTGKPGDH